MARVGIPSKMVATMKVLGISTACRAKANCITHQASLLTMAGGLKTKFTGSDGCSTNILALPEPSTTKILARLIKSGIPMKVPDNISSGNFEYDQRSGNGELKFVNG